jgi:hypothetical protein
MDDRDSLQSDSLYQVCSGQFFEIFECGLAGIFPEFLLEGFAFLLFVELLIFDQYQFVGFLGFVQIHLVIHLFHEHDLAVAAA